MKHARFFLALLLFGSGAMAALQVSPRSLKTQFDALKADSSSNIRKSIKDSVSRGGLPGSSKLRAPRLPTVFEENRGQTHSSVKFVSRTPGFGLSLTSTGALIDVDVTRDKPQPESNRNDLESLTDQLRISLVGSTIESEPAGFTKLSGISNYFTGDDPSKWLTKIPTYAGVKYTGVYPGIDLLYHAEQGPLEYDFQIAPYADPSRIAISINGAKRLRVNKQGDLVITTAHTSITQRRPFIYQQVDGERRRVQGSFALGDGQQLGFSVGNYEPAIPLVIDPEITYSTYLGESFSAPSDVAVDGEGNAYVTGVTNNFAPPAETPGFQPTASSIRPHFVAKIDTNLSDSSSLVYYTYLGNDHNSQGGAISVDSTGHAYVAGGTQTPEFPTTSTRFSACGNVQTDVFMTKLNREGTDLIYSTCLGAKGSASASDLVADDIGNFYVTGSFRDTTAASVFPTRREIKKIPEGSDAFVLRLDSSKPGNESLVFSSLLGGTANDSAYSIARPRDAGGIVYVSGFTDSTDFSASPGALQRDPGGGGDAFLSAIDTSGNGPNALKYQTYFGGAGSDYASEVAANSSDNVVLVGTTDSSNFPVSPSAHQSSLGGGTDAFVSRIDLEPSGNSTLSYSTYLGKAGQDRGETGAINGAAEIYLAGFTDSNDFPTIPGAPYPSYQGGGDAFVSQLNTSLPPSESLVSSTFLGGSDRETGRYGTPFSLALDAHGSIYVAGATESSNFPTTANAVQTTKPSGAAVSTTVHVLTRIDATVPLVQEISPNSGPVTGGSRVILSGVRLAGASQVTFGSAGAAAIVSSSDTEIVVTAPKREFDAIHQLGPVDIQVQTPAGLSPPSPSSRFTYLPVINAMTPDEGPRTGGTNVTLAGAGFITATSINFGSVSVPCSPQGPCKVQSDESATLSTPPRDGVKNAAVVLVASGLFSNVLDFTYLGAGAPPPIIDPGHAPAGSSQAESSKDLVVPPTTGDGSGAAPAQTSNLTSGPPGGGFQVGTGSVPSNYLAPATTTQTVSSASSKAVAQNALMPSQSQPSAAPGTAAALEKTLQEAPRHAMTSRSQESLPGILPGLALANVAAFAGCLMRARRVDREPKPAASIS